MNRRLLITVAIIAALCAALGLTVVDYPLARWIHDSGYVDAAFFRVGLDALDWVTGMHVWYWLAASICIAIGLLGLLLPALRLPRRVAVALITAGIVQVATLHTMIFMKSAFGRLRPHQVLESGNWDVIWNAGGGSFPSGHSAFYFGLLLTLAAFATRRWLQLLLVAIPVYVVLARIDLERHFLSDVSTSAVIAASYGLLAAFIVQRSGVLDRRV